MLGAEKDWNSLSPEHQADAEAKNFKWSWIAIHASNHLGPNSDPDIDIDSVWAQRELEKIHRKRAKT